MIARIDFTCFGELTIATLTDSLTWDVPGEPEVEGALNALLATADDSPARGRWLVGHAMDVARSLGGEISVEPKDRKRAGTIY
jgi:hypothetical protein